MLNNDAPPLWPGSMTAARRVLDQQIKLHRWAGNELDRRFDDVFNLICDRVTLVVAWERVSGNRGARTAGVDGVTPYHVEERHGVIPFLEELRSSLKDGSFTALPVKQAVIPNKSGKVRYSGIPTWWPGPKGRPRGGVGLGGRRAPRRPPSWPTAPPSKYAVAARSDLPPVPRMSDVGTGSDHRRIDSRGDARPSSADRWATQLIDASTGCECTRRDARTGDTSRADRTRQHRPPKCRRRP